MAKSEQYSRSVLRASDEVPDIYCEPCHQNGHVAIAEGYCVDCPEYLCGPCYKIHRRHKALANHVLLDKDSMPIVSDSGKGVLDICVAKCPVHSNKVIELFCETCNKLACTICVATDHRQCERVKHIPDIVEDLEHTEEFKRFNENVKSTASVISKHEEKLRANVTSVNEMRTFAKQELKHQRAEVNRFFDQLEEKINEQITAIEKRNQATLKAASDRLNNMKTDFDPIKNDMETKNTGQRCELFIAMKQSQVKMKTFQDQFYRIKGELRIQHYTLVPSEQIQAMMRKTTEICRIATARFESVIHKKVDYWYTNVDETDQYIEDLTIMHGLYCVAKDSFSSIKVIDTNSKCLTSEITVEGYVSSVTSVSDDQVAVSVTLSCGRSRYQIQFFTVSASGVIQRTKQLYDVDDWYYGMVHSAGNIYGANPKRIDKLSMTGEIIRTIHTDDKYGMRKIAASPDGQTLYVINNKKNSVTSLTLDGKVKAVYEDKDLKNPGGITVDKYGYVYVCSRGTKNIQQFTADLNKVQVLIHKDVGYGAITYSRTENILYMGDDERIHLYSLDL